MKIIDVIRGAVDIIYKLTSTVLLTFIVVYMIILHSDTLADLKAERNLANANYVMQLEMNALHITANNKLAMDNHTLSTAAKICISSMERDRKKYPLLLDKKRNL